MVINFWLLDDGEGESAEETEPISGLDFNLFEAKLELPLASAASIPLPHQLDRTAVPAEEPWAINWSIPNSISVVDINGASHVTFPA